jgi:hypothetical protein
MFSTSTRNYRVLLAVISCAAATFLIVGPVVSVTSHASTEIDTIQAKPTPPDTPSYAGYKGVKIGTPAAETRTKLGKPRDTSDAEDYFVFSDKESVQILYASDHTVRVISVNYVGTGAGAPLPKDVFGAEIEAQPDGSVFKLIRYPKIGYWISYNRTSGDDPMIIITMQKIEHGQ